MPEAGWQSETLLAPTRIRLFGRKFTGLNIGELGLNPAADNPMEAGILAFGDANKCLARIYGFVYQGHYVKLAVPTVMLVWGEGEAMPSGNSNVPTLSQLGVEFLDRGFVRDVRMWVAGRRDSGLRIDLEFGDIQELLVDKRIRQDAPELEVQREVAAPRVTAHLTTAPGAEERTANATRAATPDAAPVATQAPNPTAGAGAEERTANATQFANFGFINVALVSAGLIFVVLFAILVLGSFWTGFIARFSEPHGCCPMCGACVPSQPTGHEKTATPATGSSRDPQASVQGLSEHPSNVRPVPEADAAREVVIVVREQLEQANSRAERAENRADRAEQGRDGERAHANALRDRVDTLEVQLARAEAERGALTIEMAGLAARVKRERDATQTAEQRRGDNRPQAPPGAQRACGGRPS